MRHVRRRPVAPIAVFAAVMAVGCGQSDGSAETSQQAGATKAQPARDEMQDRHAAHPTIHVTGCVERGVIPGSFLLTGVRTNGTEAGAASAETGSQRAGSGAAGTSSDTAVSAAQRYTLRSLERGTGLDRFVGRRVAVTGRLTADRDQTGLGTRGTAGSDRPTAEGREATRSDPPGGSSAAGTAALSAGIRQLDADTIENVGGTCPASPR